MKLTSIQGSECFKMWALEPLGPTKCSSLRINTHSMLLWLDLTDEQISCVRGGTSDNHLHAMKSFKSQNHNLEMDPEADWQPM